MQTVTIPSTVDDSKKLQTIIDSTGNSPTKFIFSDTSHILVNSRIRFWNYFELDGLDSTFELMENAPTSIFGEQIPLIGSKLATGAEGWDLHNVIFEGNRDIQKYVPATSPEHPNTKGNWGRGYHNIIGPLCSGDIINPKPANASGIYIHDCEANNFLGDFGRLEGVDGLYVWNIKGTRGGHDFICAASAKDVEIWNLDIDTEVNAGVRFRSVEGGKIHDCNLRGTRGNTGPLIQIQNTADNWHCKDIDIYNNILKDSLGPGIWAIGTTGTNDVNIHRNLIVDCGIEPASLKIDDVGGICCDGFNANIEYNTFDSCFGYGIVFSGWQSRSTISGLKSIVRRNIITGTKESYTKGLKSGSGIANLTGKRNDVQCIENCQYGNKTANHYAVTNQSVFNADPLFIGPGDYHLQKSSPCILPDYSIGCYEYVQDDPVVDPLDLPAVVIPRRTEGELKAFIRALRASGYVEEEESISFLNVSDDFTI